MAWNGRSSWRQGETLDAPGAAMGASGLSSETVEQPVDKLRTNGAGPPAAGPGGHRSFLVQRIALRMTNLGVAATCSTRENSFLSLTW